MHPPPATDRMTTPADSRIMPRMHAICLISTTVDSEDAARRIADALVGERLAACVRIEAAALSVYRWQGAIETARELALHIKTTPAMRDAAVARLKALHPYELPEILCQPCEADAAYAAWVRESVSDAGDA